MQAIASLLWNQQALGNQFFCHLPGLAAKMLGKALGQFVKGGMTAAPDVAPAKLLQDLGFQYQRYILLQVPLPIMQIRSIIFECRF